MITDQKGGYESKSLDATLQEGANALAIYLSVIFSLERAGGLPAVFINFTGLHRNPSSVDQKR